MTGRTDSPRPADGRVPPDSAPSGRPTDEAPPIFGSWGTLYAAVLIFLAALIAAFALFQESFR